MSIQTEIDRINTEVTGQADLIAQIQTALEGKAGVSSVSGITSLTISDSNLVINEDSGDNISLQACVFASCTIQLLGDLDYTITNCQFNDCTLECSGVAWAALVAGNNTQDGVLIT